MPHNFSKDRSLVEDKPVEKKIGLLEEFEEWLAYEYEHGATGDDYSEAIYDAQKKLEELKEKYHVPN